MPSTLTSLHLAAADSPHYALCLVFEGYNLIVTDSEDVTGLGDAWALNTSWTTIYSGLQPVGTVKQSGAPFDARINTDSMTFGVLDDDDDTLSRIFLREANDEAITNQLTNVTTAAMTPTSPFILMDDSAAFPAAGTVYIGNEEIIYTLNGGGGLLTGLARGVHALFGTTDDASHYASPHGIDFDPDPEEAPIFSPRVSTVPLNWHGRAVGLYLCVEQDGVWTAGDDAECIWAGTIRTIDDNDGELRFECDSILQKLTATLLRRQYRAYLEEGKYLTTADGTFSVAVRRQDDTTGIWTSWSASTSSLLPSDEYYSHEEIAALINAQLDSWFDGSGISFPADQTFSLDFADTNYQWTFDDNTAGTFNWQWKIVLSPPLAYMLGYTGWVSTSDPYVRISSGSFELVPFAKVPPNPPAVEGAPLPGQEGTVLLRVRDVENGTTFEAQPTIPSTIDQTATGFIRLGGKTVIAVRPSGTANEFVFLGYVPSDTVLGLTPVDVRLTQDASGNYIPDSLEVLAEEGRTSEGVRVEQVWLELGTVGDMFLKMLLSTGSPGYNDATYDTHPEQMGLGLPARMVNITTLLALLGTLPYLLYVDKPSKFLERFESALQVHNLHAFWHRGQLTVAGFGEDAAATLSITDDDQFRPVADGQALQAISSSIPVKRTLDFLVNQITLKYNLRLGSYGEPNPSIRTVNNTASQTDLGPSNIAPVTIEAIGFYDGVELVGGDTGLVDAWVTDVAGVALAYFGQPLAEISFTYDISMVSELYPGRQVLLTLASVMNPRTGIRGVTDLPAWVVETSFNYDQGVGEGTLLFAPRNVP